MSSIADARLCVFDKSCNKKLCSFSHSIDKCANWINCANKQTGRCKLRHGRIGESSGNSNLSENNAHTHLVNVNTLAHSSSFHCRSSGYCTDKECNLKHPNEKCRDYEDCALFKKCTKRHSSNVINIYSFQIILQKLNDLGLVHKLQEYPSIRVEHDDKIEKCLSDINKARHSREDILIDAYSKQKYASCIESLMKRSEELKIQLKCSHLALQDCLKIIDDMTRIIQTDSSITLEISMSMNELKYLFAWKVYTAAVPLIGSREDFSSFETSSNNTIPKKDCRHASRYSISTLRDLKPCYSSSYVIQSPISSQWNDQVAAANDSLNNTAIIGTFKTSTTDSTVNAMTTKILPTVPVFKTATVSTRKSTPPEPSVDAGPGSWLIYWSITNNLDKLKILLTNNDCSQFINYKDDDGKGKTALMHASIEDNVAVVKLLIKFHADVDITYKNSTFTAIDLAKQRQNMKVVAVLKLVQVNRTVITTGAPRVVVESRLIDAVIKKNYPGMKLLNAKDELGVTALLRSAMNKDATTLKLLIDVGADVNAKDNLRYTALLRSAINKDATALKLLIDGGADVNAKDDLGVTALLHSAINKDATTLKLLIDCGADVNAKDDLGYTALLHSAINKDATALKLLIDGGADVNAKNNLGYTALLRSAMNKDDAALKLLIDCGADVNAKDNLGNAALHYVQGDPGIVKLLMDYGADVKSMYEKKCSDDTASTIVAFPRDTDKAGSEDNPNYPMSAGTDGDIDNGCTMVPNLSVNTATAVTYNGLTNRLTHLLEKHNQELKSIVTEIIQLQQSSSLSASSSSWSSSVSSSSSSVSSSSSLSVPSSSSSVSSSSSSSSSVSSSSSSSNEPVHTIPITNNNDYTSTNYTHNHFKTKDLLMEMKDILLMHQEEQWKLMDVEWVALMKANIPNGHKK